MSEDITQNQNGLTDTPSGQENREEDGSLQPNGSSEEELDPQTKKGFQTALQKRAEEAKAEKLRAEKAEEELRLMRLEQKKKRLEELDEAERLKVERDEALAENAKLKMSNFAVRELQKRNIKPTNPIYDIVVDAPWSIPVIRRSLGDSPSWAEVISAVEAKLPAYLDSLAFNGETTQNDDPADTPSDPTPPTEERPRDGDPERQPTNSRKRTWSRREIAKMSDEDYRKHADEIKQAAAEGRITA